jgi:hypothetical protein
MNPAQPLARSEPGSTTRPSGACIAAWWCSYQPGRWIAHVPRENSSASQSCAAVSSTSYPGRIVSSYRGAVKCVARPERLELLAHGAGRENCLPGMVDRTVYFGASVQVIVRLANGEAIQVSIANTGSGAAHPQGTPVMVHVPPDALRVLSAPSGAAAGTSSEADAAGALTDAERERVPAT